MKIFKTGTAIFLISLLLCLNIPMTSAAFELETNSATYDSNTGILTIFHSSFTNGDYTATPSKMKLGGVALAGTYEFKTGALRVFIRNKDEVNRQADYTKTGSVQDGLFLAEGAVKHQYRPPNSVNIVIESSSKEKYLDVAATGLRPKMTIDRFISNSTQVNGSGGEVTLTIHGSNLSGNLFKVQLLHSSVEYNLNVTQTTATVRVRCVENHMEISRIDTFVLFINGFESDKRVSVTVKPISATSDNASNSATTQPPELPADTGTPNHSGSLTSSSSHIGSSGTGASAGSSSGTTEPSVSSAPSAGIQTEGAYGSNPDDFSADGHSGIGQDDSSNSNGSHVAAKGNGIWVIIPAAVLVLSAGGAIVYFRLFKKR